MWTFFATYDVTTEVIMIMVCFIMLAIIGMSKPVRTHMLNIVVAGFVLSLLTMISHIIMLASTIIMQQTHNKSAVHLTYLIFCIFFVAVLLDVFLYMYKLAYKRRHRFKKVVWLCIGMGIIYYAILFVPLINRTLIEEVDGVYRLTHSADIYIWCSVLAVVFCMYTTVKHVNLVSKIVLIGCTYLFPVILLAVLAQFVFRTAYFICATYTMAFTIFYVLFHVMPYDETMGCQHADAEAKILKDYIKAGKRFVRISVIFPELESHDYKDMIDNATYVGNIICRRIEKIKHGARIYRISENHFSVIAPVKDDEDDSIFCKKLFDILSELDTYDRIRYKLHTKILVSHEISVIKNEKDYIALVKMMYRKFENNDTNEVKIVTDVDAEEYYQAALLEKELFNIANSGNLNDERVLVYIQPIYSIKDNCYKTGEALMRLKIDDKIYYPDSFIPMAEKLGCIHMLTKIILYKVAIKTKELSKYPEFEAISVNVSTGEFADWSVNEEFSRIIEEEAGANPKNIRLEITEATSINDYSVIKDNMLRLIERGVTFYLDDFGTGFSNLDRIIDMPFATIKFDKALMYKALVDEKTNALFRMLVSFCQDNKLKTVIEGVEIEKQRAFVEYLGFDYIQGYFYSKPVPIDEVDSFYIKETSV